tara:strand:+ start:206 stop:631 length:426 start_codon:yes stop_codon:yes gene_type:complete
MKSKRSIQRHNRNNNLQQSNLINVLKITSFAGLLSKLIVLGMIWKNSDDLIKDNGNINLTLLILITLFPISVSDIISVAVFILLLTIFLKSGLKEEKKKSLLNWVYGLVGFSIFVNVVFIILLHTIPEHIENTMNRIYRRY